MRRKSKIIHAGPALASLFTMAACGSPGTGTAGTPAPAEAKSNLVRDALTAIPAASVGDAVTANNAFAVDVYSRWVKTAPAGNALTSPISASLALTMTYAGAAGATATQMAAALHFGSATSTIFDGQNALDQQLTGRGSEALADARTRAKTDPSINTSEASYETQIVNSLWGEKTYTWAKPFLDVLAKSYGAGVYLEDFMTAWEPARQAINGWVSDQTGNKIQNLLPEGSLDNRTRFVLVNAIHLKLPWETPFSKEYTTPGSFTTESGATVTGQFMSPTEIPSLPYVDDGQAQRVALPLAGEKLWVVIALPDTDLGSYEAALGAGSATLAIPTGTSLVNLSLPKFSFTSPTFSLASTLKAMGMTDAFDDATADFTPMCATPPGCQLVIDDVLQKAMIALDEGGVEAAAATAVVGRTASVVEGAASMVVNHPFLVSIVDQPTGAILFLGHITDPTAG